MRLEDCPVRASADVIGGKWKPVILYHLMTGKKRFGELRRLLPDTSQKMLTQQLRELEKDEIISRRVLPDALLKVEYSLSDYGKTLRPLMSQLCKWGTLHRRRKSKNVKKAEHVLRKTVTY